ncbi:MAG: DUF362 domain-containing protein [Candidatus Omnitrophota bacterium]
MKSEVCFAKVRASGTEEREAALKRLIRETGYFSVFKKEEFVPVKLTIGDAACVYNMSPQLVGLVIAEIKKQEAKPFLFDTSVIYKGSRHNAVDHLTLAHNKGFSQDKTGAPFLVADGVFGSDGKEFTLETQEIRKIRAPSFVGMVESLVVLSHATGHIVSGYAGAIKNVAMGMSCRPTKQVQHSSLKPNILKDKCTACGCCIAICPVQAISFKDEKAFICRETCVGCGECLCACKFDAVSINWEEDPGVFCRRMVEVASFILSKFKNKLYITFAFDITRECDCISAKGEKMVAADLGILASKDILALDKATADLALKNKETDFLNNAKKVYEPMFERAAEKGLGSLDYRLIEI